MRCEEIQGHLSAYLEDEVEPTERRAMEDHLQGCVGCRHELNLLRQTVFALRSLEEIEVPPRLTAAIEAGVSDRGRSGWQHPISRLFFPMHVKLPLQAAALVLISLGAVYLYRSAPELAQAPRPPVATEEAPRGQVAAPIARGRRGADEVAALRQSAVKSEARLDDQAEREALEEAEPEDLKERDVGSRRFGLMRKEAPAAFKRAAPLRQLIIKTDNPSQAATRIAEIAESMGGKLLEARDENQLTLTIPARAYPKFLTALRDVGAPLSLQTEVQTLVRPKAEAPAKPQAQDRTKSEATLTLFLRLIP